MKKRFLPFLALMILSCGDDDESPVNLTGKWRTLSQQQYDCTDAVSNTTRECGAFGFCVNIEFKQDMTFLMTRTSDGSLVNGGTFSVAGNILSMVPAGSQSQMYSVSVQGSTLTTILNYSGPDCKTKTIYQKM